MTDLPRRRGAGCPAAATLTPTQRAELASLPDAAHVPNWHEVCSLEPGHAGPHISSAQMAHDDVFWLRWSDADLGIGEIVETPPCPATGGNVEDPELCMLPVGHEGAHNFDGNTWARASVNDNAPPPAPGLNHRTYLDHRQAALNQLDDSNDPAAVHANLAIAAALNRIADLLQGPPPQG